MIGGGPPATLNKIRIETKKTGMDFIAHYRLLDVLSANFVEEDMVIIITSLSAIRRLTVLRTAPRLSLRDGDEYFVHRGTRALICASASNLTAVRTPL